MKWLVSLLAVLALASPVLAADGDICGATSSCRIQPPASAALNGIKEPGIVVQKLCDAKTTNSDCGPSYAAVQDAKMVVIKVVTANNGGAACTFDDWGVYEMASSTAPGVTTTFGALCAIDDDTTTTLVGASAATECKIFGPVGPYIFIDAGTLGTCSDFSVWAWYYPANSPSGH